MTIRQFRAGMAQVRSGWRQRPREVKPLRESVSEGLAVMAFGAVGLPILISLAIGAYEALVWLQDGRVPSWQDIVFTDPDLRKWLDSPESWLGLHRLAVGLTKLPLSVASFAALFPVGALFGWILFAIAESIDEG